MTKYILIFLLLTAVTYAQSGKRVLTDAQKDSIGAMIRDSLANFDGSSTLPDSVIYTSELTPYVDKSSTQTITGEKTFSNTKTVFSGDSVGVRGSVRINSWLGINTTDEDPSLLRVGGGSIHIGETGDDFSFDTYKSLIVGNTNGINNLGALFNAADRSWMNNHKFGVYSLGGIRTDGGIFVDSGKVYIDDTLEVATAIKLNNYFLPSADGTAEQVIKTDGSGNLSWANDTGGSGTFSIDGVWVDTTITGEATLTQAVKDTIGMVKDKLNKADSTGTTGYATQSDISSFITASNTAITNKLYAGFEGSYAYVEDADSTAVIPISISSINATTSLADLPISILTRTALNAKQATLVSGTNIKTINSTSILGSGNIEVVADLPDSVVYTSEIAGDSIIGTTATLDSIIADYWSGNLGGVSDSIIGTVATLDSIITDYWAGTLGGNNLRTKTALDIVEMAYVDTFLIFWVDDAIIIDSIKAETTDSIKIQIRIDGTTETNLFADGGSKHLYGEMTIGAIDFVDNTLAVNDKAELYFTYIGDTATRLKLKIYWRYN